MRKHDAVRAAARRTGQPEPQVAAAVNAFFAAVEDALAGGEAVALSGFGEFVVVERAERAGRDPRTGAPTRIGPGRRVAFRVGSRLKQAVARGDGGGALAGDA